MRVARITVQVAPASLERGVLGCRIFLGRQKPEARRLDSETPLPPFTI